MNIVFICLLLQAGKVILDRLKILKKECEAIRKSKELLSTLEFKNIGWENIKLTILEKCDTRLKAHELEFFYIEKFKNTCAAWI